MLKEFNPTQEQKDLALDLFLATAFCELVKPVSEQTEQDILDTGDYEVNPIYLTEKYVRLYPDQTKLVKNRKYIAYIDGLDEYCKDPTVNNASARFYKDFGLAMRNKGFIHGENAFCIADNYRVKAERALLERIEDITNLPLDKVYKLDHYKRLVELSMKLFAGTVVKSTNREKAQKTYFSKHINHLNTPAVQEEWTKMQEFLAK